MICDNQIETKIVERVTVPLYGQESVLLHLDVFRNKDTSWCLERTLATLQLKETGAAIAYTGLPRQEVNFILDLDDFVTNKIDSSKNVLSIECQRKLKVRLILWLFWIKFSDDSIEQKYKELKVSCLYHPHQYTFKERIFNYEKFLPGLPLFKPVEKIVYLIGNKKENLVKIGVSQDVKKRLKELQRVWSSPLEIIATKRGSFDEEKRLHRQFSRFRRQGEWFTWNDLIIKSFESFNTDKILDDIPL